MNWSSVNLPEICRPKQWPTIPKTKMLSSGYTVYGANGKIGYYSEYNHEEATVLITCRGATCGSINVCEPNSYVTGNAMALDNLDKDQVSLRFLTHILKSADFSKVITGVAQPQITRQSLARLQIPLPPLAEQKRIAGILDAADALRAKRRESLADLDTLLQSTFIDMFGNPMTNPMGWEVCTLEEATTRVTDGTHQSPKWSKGGIPFLFVSNIRNRQIDFKTSKFIAEDEYSKLTKRCPIEVGDVLYTTVGSYGNPATVREGTRRFAFQRHIAHIKPKHDLIDSMFLENMLDSPIGRHQADRLARGVAQKTLNLRELKSFNIFLPPLREQHRFATIVKSIEQQKSRQRTHLAELDTLFASLQQRAFNGEL